MTTTPFETLPATWDDARDGDFFRITARLFSAEYCLGASVLLASYDDTVVGDRQTGTACSTSTLARVTASATQDDHTGSEDDLVPVQVRRPR